ncbi:MAG: acyl-CoA dehydrogenase [Candidatus Kapaibacterium sp.]|nr:MAG: acyl-CoA dehydrogenase [Candidatus Kapabacteria bacterium]GIV56808.1 MAG: acyl-CoA dehydrogenase [Candidatus Kapabacteria bacterium]
MYEVVSHGVSFAFSQEQEQIRQLAREFAEAEIRPHVAYYDETQEFPHEIFRKLGELGFLGILIPPDCGGAGLGAIECAIIVEEIARICPAVALGVAAHNGLCTYHIYRYGSQALRERYVRPLAQGETLGAWGLTEPGSGSDAGAMQTIAIRDGDHYILRGSKNFITHGNVGSIAVIMAKTDPAKGKRGISAFVVDKSMPGFYASKKENKVGMRCSDTASLVLDDVRVPATNLLGQEGEGFQQALAILDGGRVTIAALSVGLAQGAFEAAMKYAQERIQFGKPLIEHQAVAMKLARMNMEIEAARLLTYRAAWLRDRGEPFRQEASQAKLFASEIAVRTAEDAIQIHGGYGYIKEFPVEKYWRDSKLLTIGEGTSEIQRIVIARSLLEQYRSK